MIKKTLMILSVAGATLVTSCDEANKKVEEAKAKGEEAVGNFSGLSLDNLSDKAIGIVGGIPDMLMKVKDEASLDEVSGKLDSIKTKVAGFVAAAGKLPKPPKDKLAELGDNFLEKMNSAVEDKLDPVDEHMQKLVSDKPELKDKIMALKDKLEDVIRPLKNLFDEDGAIGKGAE